MHGLFKHLDPFEDARLTSRTMSLPFVTVIVTSYNYAAYIEQCLQSVADQTYPHYACVVVDDGSTDGSLTIIERFIKTKAADGRFRLVKRKKNGGQMAAFKTGLEHAQGPFVSYVDADDVLLPDFLETHVKLHLGRHLVSFTSTNQYQINQDNEVIGGNHNDLACPGDFRHVYHLVLDNPFWVWATTSSMMYRRSVLELIMPRDVNGENGFRICADYYVAHFANLIGGSLLYPAIHGCYRRHEKNYFGSNPVMGSHLPVGDMDKHPKHDMMRTAVLNHMLVNHQRFLPLFSRGGFLRLIMRVASRQEMGRLPAQWPQLFPKSGLYYQQLYVRFRTRRRWDKFKAEYKAARAGR